MVMVWTLQVHYRKEFDVSLHVMCLRHNGVTSLRGVNGGKCRTIVRATSVDI
jgi:hypothetical protein